MTADKRRTDTARSAEEESTDRSRADDAVDTDQLTLSAYAARRRRGMGRVRAAASDPPRSAQTLPRIEPGGQAKVLAGPPPLTESRWDALLAATVEHIAALHGHTPPAWVDEPARFLAETWVVTDIHSMRMDAIAFAPAAFIRHGALPDPRDLDHRCGEHRAWVP